MKVVGEHLPIYPVVHPENGLFLVKLAEHGAEINLEFVWVLVTENIERRGGKYKADRLIEIREELDPESDGRVAILADVLKERDGLKSAD